MKWNVWKYCDVLGIKTKFFPTSCTNCIVYLVCRNAIPTIIVGRKTIPKKGITASTSTPLHLAIHLKRKGKELF